MDLYPAGCTGHILTVVLCSPALEEERTAQITKLVISVHFSFVFLKKYIFNNWQLFIGMQECLVNQTMFSHELQMCRTFFNI